MASLPRPILTPALVCASLLTFSAPAHAAGPSSLRTLADVFTATASKQFNKDTAIIGSDPAQTLRNLSELVKPTIDPACATQPTSKPFAPWRDNADYVPVPNSGFEEGLDRWTAFGKVALTPDNNAFYISGRPTDKSSVTLSVGASIASASFCGGIQYPTIRMMTRSANGRPAKATVTVRYTGRDGLIAALPLGTVTAGASWAPSEITLTASGVPLFTGSKLGVTITGSTGTIVIDDVYVDPYRRT